MDLRHIDEVEGSNVVDIGMDLSEFYMSVEWDILEVPAVRYVMFLLLLPPQRKKKRSRNLETNVTILLSV